MNTWRPGSAAMQFAPPPPAGDEADALSFSHESSAHTLLWQVLWRHSGLLGAVCVYAAGVGLLTLATPVAVQALVSNVAFGTLLQPLVVLSTLLFAGLGLRGVLKVMQAWVVEALQRQLFVDFAEEAAARLPRVSPNVHREHSGPELANRFFDIYTLQKSLASLMLGGLDAVLTAGVGMIVLAFYHPLLLGFDLVLVAVLVGWVAVLGRGGVSTAVKESKSKYALAHTLEQALGHPISARSEPGRKAVQEMIDVRAEAYLVARSGHFRIVLRQLVGAVFLQATASAALLGVGGWLVIERQLTLGQLVAAELIVTGVVAAFASLGKHAETYYDLLAALEKLGMVLGLPHERTDGQALRPGARPASLELGCLHTPAGETSLKVPAGGCCRVYAADATGLFGQLYGFPGSAAQTVKLDGLNLRDLSLDGVREHVAWVQGTEIWAASLLENVRFEAADTDVSLVRAALETVGLAEVVGLLPEGLNTQLTPTGSPLSESEAWLLTLARALVRRPRLLLLGREVDMLSPQVRSKLVAALSAENAPWTLLVSSNDSQLDASCTGRLDLHSGAFEVCP